MSQYVTEQYGFFVRPGTNDGPAVAAIVGADEYRLRDRNLSGWVIDIGSHTGAVAIFLAQLYPDLRIVAVEAVPENCDLVERNIARFGFGDRITSVRAFAGAPGQVSGTCHYGYQGGDIESADYVAQHRFVANTWMHLRNPDTTLEMPAVSLDDLLAAYDIDDVALLKIDCEGCEWAFLDSPAIARVALIVGEYHGGYPGQPGHVQNPRGRILELLDGTHDVMWRTGDPTVGEFEATRR